MKFTRGDLVMFDGKVYTFSRKLKSIDDTALVKDMYGFHSHVDYSSLTAVVPTVATNKEMRFLLEEESL